MRRREGVGPALAFVALVTLAVTWSTALAAPAPAHPYVLVLGIAQDGGIPQAGCRKSCCTSGRHEDVASLALVEPAAHRWWLFDATPDFRAQLARVAAAAPACSLAGIFLTHAHIGHYTGLMHLGREAMGARDVPVWAMPRMSAFLSANGPWDQLVKLHNIELHALHADSVVALGDSLTVTPFRVPHRDEYSETVGFRIASGRGEVVFVPDIDKWERWDRDVGALVAHASAAYLDGTFFDGDELPGRDMSEIPHPFIVESLARFASLPEAARRRIHFIHLNHTNRAAIAGTVERRRVEAAGCRVATAGERTEL
jgi:pyrroloquinoline quinone biosynthesis protein B